MSHPSSHTDPTPGDQSVGSATERTTPTHNWRPTVVHGAAALALLGVAALAVPAGHPLSVGVGVAAVLVAPTLPVALYCDYRQARRAGTCDPGPAAYLRNLARDVRGTVAGESALGSARRAFARC
ncbi:hypothetical protein [Haloarcula litorea]|uniref:hypothetical protein n=1 Tax=Haloarcula litorea TaxID=3032579 RepID=UPI0023E8E117|nr:hypothetical protein [Halomicroarcula sp. GDY20]